jgi:hypothetical protein
MSPPTATFWICISAALGGCSLSLPSSGPLGPPWGHIRATNDWSTADKNVTVGLSSAQLTDQAEADVAGRRDAPRLPDTEADCGQGLDRPCRARLADRSLVAEDRSAGGVRDRTGPKDTAAPLSRLANDAVAAEDGPHPSVTGEPTALRRALSSSLAVPLACHSQPSRPVPSGQPRTTPRRPQPAPFAKDAGSQHSRSGFGSRGSLA